MMLQSAIPTSVLKPYNNRKERLHDAFATAIDGLQTALRIVKGISDGVGLGPPGLQAGLSGLLLVLDAMQKTSQNAADIEQLSMKIHELCSVLQRLQHKGSLSPSIMTRIDQLSNTLNGEVRKLKHLASRNLMKRLFFHGSDSQAISACIQSITWSIQNITVQSLLTIEFTLDVYARFMKRAVVDIQSGIGSVREQMEVKEGQPPHVSSARFNCGDRVPCLDGTRTDIIERIRCWIGQNHDMESDPSSVSAGAGDAGVKFPLFWINGSAGTGKTTIAYTIAKACDDNNTLGASFFCSRDDAACSDPKRIFPTIAYQLGFFCPSFGNEVARVLKSRPDISYSDLSYQLEQLIVNPLRAVGKSFPACIVVIDALDECKDNQATSVVLSSLSLYVKQLSPLKILITSRPERSITTGFGSDALSTATERFHLHEMQLGVVQHDIESYLTAKLVATRKLYHLQDPWPLTADIAALSRLSFGLFIFAATSVKFIEDSNYSDPAGQLQKLLRGATKIVEGSSPHRYLDRLYMQVLSHAYPNISPDLAGRLKMVLGSIVLLRDPLSATNLERLLDIKSESADSSRSLVRTTLIHLHSVVIFPEDDTQVIRLLHPSFFDFIIDPDRCLNAKLVVNTEAQHTLLAQGCLHALKDLTRNICRIRGSTVLQNEVDDLSARITRYIPAHLQYACRHWASHLTCSMVSDILLDLLEQFCSGGLLHWVEVCSLLGDLRSLLLSLDRARQTLAKSISTKSEVMTLLLDCERFVREFFPILSTCPQQVYHSALVFTPSETLLSKKYLHELPPARMKNWSEKVWNSCLRTIEGHTGTVRSVAFSADGTRVMSGSEDKTIRLWDTVTGAHLNTLTGHSDWIRSVAFSPDGTRIVSGSSDKTLRLWDAVTGVHLHTLEGHLDCVRSVAFSPDSTCIVSGSSDKTIRLWDAATGVLLNTLYGHSSWIRSVGFSPDGAQIISGSQDKTLRLWDAVNGTHISTLKGHTSPIRSVAFSPDGTRIASGSDSHRSGGFGKGVELRSWNAVSGTQLKNLKGHSKWIYLVAFSPDGSRIVSGSADNTIRLWDSVTGNHLSTLVGHSTWVRSVAFSPDGTRILSGSSDNTLRLWDAVTKTPTDVLKGQTNDIRLLTFSPDGTRVVSVSRDNALRLWDGVSGARVTTLKGHSRYICSFAFSPDSTRILSGEEDNNLLLWDAISGTRLNSLGGGPCGHSVAFSLDGTLIVSGSFHHTIGLWDAVSGTHIKTLKGPPSWVMSVAFSPDGTRLVSGGSPGAIRLWDVATGALLNTLKGGSQSIYSVAFSADGINIVAGDSDGNFQLWDSVAGTHIKTLKGQSGPATLTAFSSDCVDTLSQSSSDILRRWAKVSGHKDNMHYYMEDGWIYLATPHQRLCWIPLKCRGLLASSGKRVALGTVDGRVVIFDLSDVIV